MANLQVHPARCLLSATCINMNRQPTTTADPTGAAYVDKRHQPNLALLNYM